MTCKMLPIEILCKIFLLLCDKPIHLQMLQNKWHLDEFPWAVGQVCRHWRGAFLSYPPLWTSLSLQSGNFSAIAIAEINRRTATYLERSRQFPLTILVSMVNSSNINFPSDTFRLLLTSSNRWKRADLVLRRESVLLDLIGCFNKVPILESLGISVYGFGAEKHYNDFVTIAPHLTELNISDPGETGRWMSLPWSQLTKLSIEVSFVEFFVQNSRLETILSQLQNLEELRFEIHDAPDFTISRSQAAIRLPLLRFLEITMICPGIFSSFEVPLLEHLWLDGCIELEDVGEICAEELSSMIERSSCRIRHLTLQDFFDDDVALDIFGALDSLEELCIKDLSCSLLIGFMANPDVHHLPNLRELQVICCPGQVNRDLMMSIYLLLDERGKGSESLLGLERVMIQLEWDHSNCQERVLCKRLNVESRVEILDMVSKMMRGCPFIADIYIDNQPIG
ncbi:hypothetical protein F5887DRAFT_947345 [Amanita rubescens]|nr:hypothetical protein F5887DRAFT_947345 [Amanita rubescens]